MRAALSAVLLGITLGVAVLAGAQAPTREPNELGRVIILEYHKIDTPEARAFGSHEGERASIAYRTAAGELRRGRIIDVYLAPMP